MVQKRRKPDCYPFVCVRWRKCGRGEHERPYEAYGVERGEGYPIKGTVDLKYKIHMQLSTCRRKKIVCKHKIALLFTAFPKEADRYIAEIEEYEREEASSINQI